MSKNYFRGDARQPFHLSVGAVVLNQTGKIACHHVRQFDGKPVSGYVLMRETIEPQETIEVALARGLQEEFGLEAELVSYVGSVISQFEGLWHNIEKTTLYFLMKYKRPASQGRNLDDPEVEGTDSIIEWHSPKFLMAQMAAQTEMFQRPDIDESKVVAAAVKMRKNLDF